jgi:hypothetical protein
MDTAVVAVALFVVALVLLDVLALRFGADSRSRDGRPDWW